MRYFMPSLAAVVLLGCQVTPELPPAPPDRAASVFRTSASGEAMAALEASTLSARTPAATMRLRVFEDREKQTLFGVGGSLTQASAAALRDLPPERRTEVLAALFGSEGAQFALSRTHIGSSDFSERSYTYVTDEDPALATFSLKQDEDNGLLALIRDAEKVPGADFDLIASPWTAPAWMKDNGKLYEPEKGRGGKLLPEHYGTFADYLVRYLQTHAEEGRSIWALTPVNEPQGNAGTWESMEMSAEEQRDFLAVLGPKLREAKLDTQVLVFDQNRAEMPEFTEVIYDDPTASPFAAGAAMHWYNSTFRVYEDVLDAQHAKYPDKWIIHSEGTIDSVSGAASCEQTCSNTPCGCETLYAWWQDDPWYWKKEATDWGWDWAQDREVDHPKYAPAFRYARDLVVSMDHWVAGWVDWNVVLNKRGGPNHVGNYCLAPILVDAETGTVYYTPLYSILKQVSRHARPGGVVLENELSAPEGVHAVAIRNPNREVAVHVFNEGAEDVSFTLEVGEHRAMVTSQKASLTTWVVSP